MPATYVEYLTMLEDVFAECVEKLEAAAASRSTWPTSAASPTARCRPTSSASCRIASACSCGARSSGARRGAGGELRLGLVQEPANPVLRDLTERWSSPARAASTGPLGPVRAGGPAVRGHHHGRRVHGRHPRRVGARPRERHRVGHPAPFPVELPQRLIDLYTYEGDVVLDPFMGSGTTAVAAVRLGRRYLGYDTDEAYVDIARRRERAGRRGRRRRRPGAARPDKAATAAGRRAGRGRLRRRPEGHQAPSLRRVAVSFDGRQRRERRRVAGRRGRALHDHRGAPGLADPRCCSARSGEVAAAHHRRARPRAHHRPPRAGVGGDGGGRAAARGVDARRPADPAPPVSPRGWGLRPGGSTNRSASSCGSGPAGRTAPSARPLRPRSPRSPPALRITGSGDLGARSTPGRRAT